MYQLLRTPLNLGEPNAEDDCLAIWRDNANVDVCNTIRCHRLSQLWQYRPVLGIYSLYGPKLYIVGRTEKAIAETAAFFLSLAGQREADLDLVIASRSSFDFRLVGSQGLNYLYATTSSRNLTLRYLTLSVEQSIFLATRPHPMQVTVQFCNFEDQGTEFVDALASRKTSFGSLAYRLPYHDDKPFADDIMRRLLQVDTIKELNLSCLQDELALLPFSARVEYLDYEIDTSSLLEADLQCLEIVTKKLSLSIYHDFDENFPTELLGGFFQRVATLGHFVELKVAIHGRVNFDIPDCFVQEIIRAARANCSLRLLDLCDEDDDLDWDPHVKTLLHELKDHKELQTLRLNGSKGAFGPDFSHLQQFLSHKRNVTVTDGKGRIHTNYSSVDKLYALNRFYRGSAKLAKVPGRPILFGNALMNSAWNDFQRIALLLSNHSDVVHDFVQKVLLEEDHESVNSSQSTENNEPKRRRLV